MDQQLPNDIDCERAFLGAAILNAAYEASQLLNASDFYSTMHGVIFESILKLVKSNKPVNLQSVTSNVVNKKNDIEHHDISRLLDFIEPSSLQWLADRIRTLSIKRQLIMHSLTIASRCNDPNEDLDKIIYDDSNDVKKIVNSLASGNWIEFNSISGEMIEDWEKRKDSGNSGIATGLVDIDRMLCGLQDTDLIIIGARPSMGKTALAQKIATNVAMSGKPVCFRSIEMRHKRIYTRVISSLARIDSERFKTGDFNSMHWEKIIDISAKLDNLPLFIDDTPYENIQQLQRSIKSFHREHGHCLVIIDYLQYITGIKSERADLEIGTITRGLKQVANELYIPIVLLAQLNRKVEERNDKRPIKSDLRGSGEIEQDADVIAFLYRDEVYNPNGTLKNGRSNIGYAEFIISKNRDGQTATVPLTFLPQFATFENYSQHR